MELGGGFLKGVESQQPASSSSLASSLFTLSSCWSSVSSSASAISSDTLDCSIAVLEITENDTSLSKIIGRESIIMLSPAATGISRSGFSSAKNVIAASSRSRQASLYQ